MRRAVDPHRGVSRPAAIGLAKRTWLSVGCGVLLTIGTVSGGTLSSDPEDLNGDGSMNIADAVALLAHLFSGADLADFDCDGDGLADTGVVPALGDVGGDGQIDIADAVRYLAYLFNGGAPPVAIACDTPIEAAVAAGFDWTLPVGSTPPPNSGFFSEASDPAFDVNLRSVDVTWRQLEPIDDGFTSSDTGGAQGMTFPSLATQLADPSDFWMRLWTSGVDWAPTWVPTDCTVSPAGTDYDGQPHLPIWDPCVWDHVVDVYRQVFLVDGLRSDPRLRFIYVPGAFTWCEFDFDIVSEAVDAGTLTQPQFQAWFTTAMQDLVDIFNGENSDPTDDYAYKLVFTGEDYPFGPDSWGTGDDLFALEAVQTGLGIRTGITELFNFHLNHVPSYGTTIDPDGYMVTDEDWELFDGERIVATENECYTACGYSTTEVEYAVIMSNLKALQLRVNWLYVYPADSYMTEFADHWEYVRQSLGHTADTSPDAWVALREFEDRYWLFDDAHSWTGQPWVRNYERWLLQRDVGPDGMSQLGSGVFTNILDPDNGTAYEGRQTDLAQGQTGLYFDVHPEFLDGGPHDIELKLTYWDNGAGSFVVEYVIPSGATATAPVAETNTDQLRTATFAIPNFVADGSLNGFDFVVRANGSEDVEMRFVRIVRATP